jgi:recombination protein RecA
MFDRGISYEGDLIDLAVELGIVEKQGSWFSYGAVRLGQGREHAKGFLTENKDLAEEIRQAILAKGAVQLAAKAPAAEAEASE